MQPRPSAETSSPCPSVLVLMSGPFGYASSIGERSGEEERLDGPALVHGRIPLGRLLQRQGEVEDLARVDPAVDDPLDEVGQEAAHRRGTAADLDVRVEELGAIDRDAMRHADDADAAAGAGG